MEHDYAEEEDKLRRFAERVHRGWAKQYPGTDQERTAVRQVIREQWQREDQVRRTMAEARRQLEKRTRTRTKDIDKRGVDRGHDNDQGHSH